MAAGHRETAAGKVKPSYRHTRVKTGCLTCRTRRKKCSEEKPTCTGCKRNGLICEWPPNRHLLGLGFSSSSEPSADPSPESEDSTESTRMHSEELATIWKPSLNAFVLSHHVRAASLYPTSGTLLSHYVIKTAPICSHRPAHVNPFITHVLPLAASDDLLMNTILALAGAHVLYRQDQFSQTHVDTHKHYALALQALRTESTNGMGEWNYEKCLRTLLVLLLLAHTEAVRGDLNGSIFPHLRACRPMMVTLLARSGPDRPGPLTALEGFVAEMYIYLVIQSRIVPDDMTGDRSLENDTFLLSLDWLKKYPGSGIFIDWGMDLFEKIPVVAALASERLAYFNAVQRMRNPGYVADSHNDSEVLNQRAYDVKVSLLLAQLHAWESPPVPVDALPRSDGFIAAGQCFREALIIYIKACCLTDVDATYAYSEYNNQPNEYGIYYPIPTPQVLAEIDIHLEHISHHLLTVIASPHGAISLWPWIISASCYRTDEFRRMSFERMSRKDNAYGQMGMVDSVKAMLTLLWQDDDPRAYGPFGLQRLMQRHAFNLSVA